MTGSNVTGPADTSLPPDDPLAGWYPKLFGLLAEHLPCALVVSDPAQRTLYANPRFAELFGYPVEAHLSVEDWWPLAYPDPEARDFYRERWHRAVAKAIAEAGAIEPQHALVTCRDGQMRHVEFRFASTGSFNLVIGIDHTEVARATRAMHESERRYRLLFEAARDAQFILAGPDWLIIDHNPAAWALFGVGEQGLHHRSLADFSPPEQAPGLATSRVLADVLALADTRGGLFREWRHRHADGHEFPATWQVSALTLEGHRALHVTVRDISLEREAHARLQALAEMEERQRQSAERENREKSRFLAQAVHDLKQPLQAMAYALLPLQARLEACRDPTALDLLELVTQASHAMRDQVAGLLDLSRLESGLVRAALHGVDLREWLDSVHRAMVAQAEYRGVRLEPAVTPEGALVVHTDPELLRQILVNLIGNAIKFTDPGKAPYGKVRVIVEADPAVVRITVADNGIGIAEEHLASGAIYKPFFQIHNTLPQGEKGVGLGLSIVKATLALLPEHALTVTSTLGEGSRFCLSVPRAEAIPARALVEVGMAASVDLSGRYIVMVDDDQLVRRAVVALLELQGVRYDAFDSVAELEATLASLEREPDVLLSDFRLAGGMTAYEVMALVRSVWPRVPTLVVTGDAEAAADLATRADVFGVLRKPVDPAELLAVLAKVCQASN